MRLELSIDDLVLVGFEPADRHRIADAVRSELLEMRWSSSRFDPAESAARSAERSGDGSPRAIAEAVRSSVVDVLAGRSNR